MLDWTAGGVFMESTTRRSFVKKAAIGTGIAAAPAVRPSWGQSSPNDRINMATVGIASRGVFHYNQFQRIPNVRISHLCDVDERLFPANVAALEKSQGYRPETVVDFRKLIEDKDIDVLSIATPDHWHGLQTIWACQAEKDVYVEKPVCFTVKEGRTMVQAARKYNRIVQCGLDRRSRKNNQAVMKFIHGESFGKPYRARVVLHRGRVSIGKVQEASIPAGLNWDMYLGPAPYRAFDTNRFHYGWHFFWDTSTTEIGNNGVHYLDYVRWGMKLNEHPTKIVCSGGKFVDDDDAEVPNVMQAIYHFADGKMVDLDMTTLPSPPSGGLDMGAIFYTPEGYVGQHSPKISKEQRAEMMSIYRAAMAPDATPEQKAAMAKLSSMMGGWKAVRGDFTPGDRPDSPPGVSNRARNLSFPNIAYEDGPKVPTGQPASSHFENFIECVRSRRREDLRCEIEQGHMSTALCHLAVIAYKTGRTLTFDPKTETFPGDAEANALLTRKYREPYTLPETV
jgi:predicted dehydrogenase